MGNISYITINHFTRRVLSIKKNGVYNNLLFSLNTEKKLNCSCWRTINKVEFYMHLNLIINPLAMEDAKQERINTLYKKIILYHFRNTQPILILRV